MTDPASALSAVPAAGDRRAIPMPAHLAFYYGPMDCGKSTLALQIDYNHARQGRSGLLLTRRDRSAKPQITSRIGWAREASEVSDETDLRQLVREHWSAGQRVDYLIVDEAQFLTAEHVDQLAELVDESHVDVYAFGLATDFQTQLFPGSRRLFELADLICALQVEVLCWCGLPARFNARVHDGVVVREGAQVVVADTALGTPAEVEANLSRRLSRQVRYRVLCRRHWRQGDLGPVPDVQEPLPLA